MQSLGWLSIALCALQVTSLPVSSEMSEEDTKVMKCVVEVISDTLSKTNAVPISPECLQTLRGDERIVSILRHQNLLKELQQLAAKGAGDKVRQQKKSSGDGFEDELSKVVEHPEEGANEREKLKEISSEDSATSSTEVRGEKKEQDSEKNNSEEERNSLEEREPSEHKATPEEEEDENKEENEQMESNEIGDHEEALKDEGIDNHITDDVNTSDLSEEKHQEHEFESEDTNQSREFKEEKQHVSKENQEEREEDSNDEHEEDQSASEGEHLAESNTKTSQEDMEDETQSKQGNPEDALDSEKVEKIFESDDKSHEDLGRLHHLENDKTHEDDNSQAKETKSEEVGPSSSKELEDSKRWNKMDELAKELMSKKRMVENESEEEDPDRAMRIPFRSHKYDFNSGEHVVRRSWKHPLKEDSDERVPDITARPNPEEKKDEEGSANRRTEDQELESLSAIEAELEKVAHKLHELRRA